MRYNRYIRPRALPSSFETLEVRTLLSTLIALVDTGVPLDRYRDFYDMADAYNSYSSEYVHVSGEGVVKDTHNHGTALTELTVQGILDAMGQPGADIADVKILPIKYQDPVSGVHDNASIIRGIRYAADKGAAVINVSVGAPGNFSAFPFYGTVSEAIQYAEQKGSVVVTASGNDGVNLDGSPVVKMFPAFSDDPDYNGLGTSLSNLLVATAVDSNGDLTRRANGSLIPNWGPVHVDLGAPTASDGKTSYAAGYVSGVTGVIAALTPGWTASQRIDHIKQTVVPHSQSVGSWSTTGGNISPAGAVGALNLLSSTIDDAEFDTGGFSKTGTWSYWTGAGYQNDHSTANGVGTSASPTATATWTFSGLTPGEYRIRGTWVQASNRASDAPFTIKDGGTTLTTVRMNQQSGTTVDAYGEGVPWWYLGGSSATYTITGSTLVVQLGNNANAQVVADGVRLQRIGDAPQQQDYIDDAEFDTDGFSKTGTWSYWTGAGFQNDHSTANGVGTSASPTATATWTFTGLTPGQYRIRGTWVQASNRASDAPFTIKDGGTTLATARMNQQSGTPVDRYDAGLPWWYLGGPSATYTITGSTLVVQLSNNANAQVVADGMWLERVAARQFLDDVDGSSDGFSRSGPWSYWTGAGYQNDHSTANGVGTSASPTATATWTFSGLTPGQYRVSGTWVSANNRATDSPFTIKDGGTTLGTVRMSQQPGLDVDFYNSGVSWWYLGGPSATYTITGSTLVIQLGNNANGQVVADGIAIEPVFGTMFAPGAYSKPADAAPRTDSLIAPLVDAALTDGWDDSWFDSRIGKRRSQMHRLIGTGLSYS